MMSIERVIIIFTASFLTNVVLDAFGEGVSLLQFGACVALGMWSESMASRETPERETG